MKTNNLLFITLAIAAFITLSKSINHQNPGIHQSKAFIGAGIAALINVGLAWGTALEEIRSHKEYLTARSQEQEFARRQAEVIKVTFNELIQEVKEQEQFVEHLRKLAQQEHERWEATVKRSYRRWCNADPKRLERFKQFYSQLNDNRDIDTGNGKQILSRKN